MAEVLYLPTLSEIMEVAESRGDDSDAPHLWRGLVGAWPLQEPGGAIAFDVSGRRNNASLTNIDPATARVIGKQGRDVLFGGSGSNDYLTLASEIQLGTADWTFSTWADIRSLVAWAGFFCEATGFKSRTQFGNGTNHLYLFDYNNAGGNWVNPLSGVSSDTHYVITRAGSVITLYINGKSRGALGTPGTGNYAIKYLATRTPNDVLNGTMRAPAVHARALATAEIQQLYADQWAMYRLRAKVFPAAAASGPITATPDAVSATWSVVAPTLAKSIEPAAVAETWTPTAVATAKTITPDAVAATWSVPLANAGTSFISTSPDPVVATWTPAAPTLSKTTAPDAVAATFTPPAIATTKTLAVDPVALTWSAVAAEHAKAAAASAVSATWSVTVPTTTGGSSGLAEAVDPVTVTWTVVVARASTKPTLSSSRVLGVRSESRILAVRSESRVLKVMA